MIRVFVLTPDEKRMTSIKNLALSRGQEIEWKVGLQSDASYTSLVGHLGNFQPDAIVLDTSLESLDSHEELASQYCDIVYRCNLSGDLAQGDPEAGAISANQVLGGVAKLIRPSDKGVPVVARQFYKADSLY